MKRKNDSATQKASKDEKKRRARKPQRGQREQARRNRQRKESSQATMSAEQVRASVKQMIGDDMHAKRVLSLGSAVDGAMAAASLSVSAIGRALADEHDLDPKHATKQVDRLLSNRKIEPWALMPQWIRYLVAERTEIIVVLDWTDFDKDDHSTLALHLVTSHGRTTPLVWRTVKKSELKRQRNRIESEVIEHLHQALDPSVRVILLADRGFGDHKRYMHLDRLGWGYVIRFKGSVYVENVKGESKRAVEWMHKSGRAHLIKNARVTKNRVEIGGVVVVHDKKMKEPWCLAIRLPNPPASAAVKLYGKRFRIEESFRDAKDLRFGMGLSASRTKSALRRDRLLLIAAIAQVLLTLLGGACEATGFDRRLKVNTSKKRTHSLFTQGAYWFRRIPRMHEDAIRELMGAFDEIVREQKIFSDVFGLV